MAERGTERWSSNRVRGIAVAVQRHNRTKRRRIRMVRVAHVCRNVSTLLQVHKQ